MKHPPATNLLAARLAAQGVSAPCRTVAEAATRLLGLQAQDFGQSQWALGVRTQGATLQTVERAYAQRQVVRTWPMRGTLHVVPASEAWWLVGLCAKRNLARAASRLRALGVGPNDVAAARRIVERELRSHPEGLNRAALFALLEKGGQRTATQRGVHLLWHLAQDRVLCLNEERFVLLEDWVKPRRLDGDEALGELAARYVAGHGPSTLEDFVFWAGLTKNEAKRAMEIAGVPVASQTAPLPDAVLLPGFDEYLLGYADRSASLKAEHFERVVPGGNGVFLAMVVLQGRISGTWRRRVEPKGVTITVESFEQFTASQRTAIEKAAQRYGTFHGKPVQLVFAR